MQMRLVEHMMVLSEAENLATFQLRFSASVRLKRCHGFASAAQGCAELQL
jgi:hypothetical protein